MVSALEMSECHRLMAVSRRTSGSSGLLLVLAVNLLTAVPADGCQQVSPLVKVNAFAVDESGSFFPS